MLRPATLLLVAAIASAGCIALPADPDALTTEPTGRTGGEMTGEETRSDDTRICTSEVGLDNDRRFCATRTIVVTGKITDLPELDIGASTFNGGLHIERSTGSAWGFTATLRARGTTAEDATRALDQIDLRWAHRSAQGHLIDIVAEKKGDKNDELGADLSIQLPASTTFQVAGGTSNGDASVRGIRASALSMTTSNGEIAVDADVGHVSLTSANGAITGKLRPMTDGRWMATTANGDISLSIPERTDLGYELEGTTSNGEVEFSLRDGQQGPCPEGSQYYTPPCSHRTFTSARFAQRATQVNAKFTTSNGEITATPT